MENKIRTAISYIFGKYDMRKGDINQARMEKVYQACMCDITQHPGLVAELTTKAKIEFYVMQTILYML